MSEECLACPKGWPKYAPLFPANAGSNYLARVFEYQHKCGQPPVYLDQQDMKIADVAGLRRQLAERTRELEEALRVHTERTDR